MTEDRIPSEQPWADRWMQLIDERFAFDAPLTRVDLRRRELVIALSRQPGGQAAYEDLTTIAPALVNTYAQKSPKALRHDATRLLQMGLVWIEDGFVRTQAFNLFEPRPPVRLSSEQSSLLHEALEGRGEPELLRIAARLAEGRAISQDEARRIIDVLMSGVDGARRPKRALERHCQDLLELADAIWNERS